MSTATFSVHTRRAVVLEQTERTKNSSMADIKRLIEESELKIISLNSQINPLVKLRDREHACVAALRYLISPVRILPVELLADIFDLVVDKFTHIHDAFEYRKSVRIGGWSLITPRDCGRGLFEYISRVEVTIGSRPMSMVPVSLVLESGGIDNRILEEVLSTGSRWRSLDLRVRNPPLSLVSRLAQCRLDNLEQLDLGMRPFDDDIKFEENIEPTFPSFTIVSRLRKLTISIFSDALPIIMPWAQLTDLTLFCDSPDITLDILAQCANLVRVSARTTGWPVSPDAGRDIVALDRVRTLSLPFYGWAGPFPPFFDYLSVPLLEDLRLNFSDMMEHKEWSEAHFTAFQLRAPNITRLELSYLYLTLDALRAAISHAPSLTHLELNYCHQCFDDALIDALTYKNRTGTLAPRLHHLVLENMECDNIFTEDILGKMIASRWWSDTELASHLARLQLLAGHT
ncbi:hypothetical protein B0H12DRAFT_1329989 [Mycena haematopus]|nr:hypothetical protein B0H12DRAFT_1329989 [Mycena haematopus]